MPSKPDRIYNSDELRVLIGVFEKIRNASDDLYGTDLSTEQAAELGTIILECFSAGESDPEVLKSIALRSISRQRPD